jgi:hypothetical protein
VPSAPTLLAEIESLVSDGVPQAIDITSAQLLAVANRRVAAVRVTRSASYLLPLLSRSAPATRFHATAYVGETPRQRSTARWSALHPVRSRSE